MRLFVVLVIDRDGIFRIFHTPQLCVLESGLSDIRAPLYRLACSYAIARCLLNYVFLVVLICLLFHLSFLLQIRLMSGIFISALLLLLDRVGRV